MKIKTIKETQNECFKLIKFSNKKLQQNYIILILELIKKEKTKGKNYIFYTNLSKGGVQLKNKIIDQIDYILEAGFIKRKNGKVYFKIITNK